MGLDKFRRGFRIAGPLDVGGTVNFAGGLNLQAGGTIAGAIGGSRTETGTIGGSRTFSGTIAGSPAFSGTPTFSGVLAGSRTESGTIGGSRTFEGTIAGAPVFSGTPSFSNSQFRAPFSFHMVDIAAAQTTVALNNYSFGTAATAQGSVYPMPAAGTIRSFAVSQNAAASAGTATYAVKAGTVTALSGTITDGSGTVITGGATAIAAGADLALVITTSADWNGTGADATAVVLVEF